MKNLILGISAGILSILFPANVFAGQCTNYKYAQLGVKVFETNKGPKIVSTGQATVRIDDIDEVNDAYDEAKLKAMEEIVAFYQGPNLTKECGNGKSTMSNLVLSSDADGDSGTYSKTKIKEIICNTRTSSAGVIKGAITVEQCYQKEEGYVLLTLGISPTTLEQAAGLKDNINYGIQNSEFSNSPNKSGGLVPTEGFYYLDEDF